MSIDLFEQLAERDVPPPPETFRQELHGRLNRALLAIHVVEFAVVALGRALIDFLPGLRGLLAYTITGKMPVDRRHDSP